MTTPPTRSRERKSAKSGGAFALTGFAYQLLGSIDWSTRVVVNDAHANLDQLSSVTITLEPDVGTDAIHQQGPDSSAVQFKTRSKGRWADASIVRHVLPDLYKATTAIHPITRFVFQSNAESAPSSAFLRLQELLKNGGPHDALQRAEQENLQFRIPSRRGPQSVRTFFNWAGAIVTQERESQFSKSIPNRDRFARLLALFEIGNVLTEDTMAERIDERLRRVIAHPENAEQTRRLLLGTLFDLAKRGNVTGTIADLLERCGIPVSALRCSVAFERRLQTSLHGVLERLGYSLAADSRDTPPFRPSARATALCGPSGVGKTWALARAAATAQAAGMGVIWIEGPKDRTSLRNEIANTIQAARGHRALLRIQHASRGLISMQRTFGSGH